MALSRRSMILSGVAVTGGLAVAYGWQSLKDGDARAKFAATTPDKAVIHAYVKIGRDGRVVIAMPMAELGQGVATAVPQLVAEELDADWSMVDFELAPIDKDYGSYVIAEAVPAIFLDPGRLADATRWALNKISPLIGMVFTGGSSAIFGNYNYLRLVGATAREMLKAAAAAQLGVPARELTTDKGRVIHAASNRSLGYGELAEAAAQLPTPSDPPLRAPENFKLIGQPLNRLDAPMKVDGSAVYGIDLRLPDMVYAAIRHAPVYGSTVGAINADSIKDRPGVIGAFKAGPDCVAAVADSTWRAEQAVRALDVAFAAPTAGVRVDTADLTAGYKTQFDAPDPAVLHTAGDAAAAFAAAAKTVEAVYEVPYLAHLCMEPMNATALYEPAADGNPENAKVTVWAPSQSTSQAQGSAAKTAGVPKKNVRVHNVLMGGGFGRRADMDFVRQAVTVAMQVPGRPVKLTWSREQDVRHDTYRPAGVARFKGALDAAGNATALDFLVVAKTVSFDFGTRNDSGFQMEPRKDQGMVSPMSQGTYAIPNLNLAIQPQENLVPSGNWRSVAASHNGFYQESFIDELAHAAGVDPVEFRRRLLQDKPLHKAVLDAVAEKAGWGTPLAPAPGGSTSGARRGRGVALLDVFLSTIGQVIEVTVAADGALTVDRVVSVVDPHTAVNPNIISAQIESAVIDGLSAALYGKVQMKDGAAVTGNFDDYRMMKLADTPPIVETYVMAQGGHPGGIGEVGLPGIAPALCNAIFAATGQRIRTLPVAPEGVVAV